jgi:hypothetical protein
LHPLERSSRAKTLEAIDEYRRAFELTDDDRRYLAIVSQGSQHQLLGLGLSDPIASKPLIE